MIRIEEIINKVTRRHPQADLDVLRRAYFFSARHHEGQQLPSGAPYLVHCLEVANMLADLGQDEVGVGAGLICSVVSETLVNLSTINEAFGDEVANIIDETTRPVRADGRYADPRSGIVKLMERLSTLRRLKDLEPGERERIASETIRAYVPLAQKLGLEGIRKEYEALAYPYTELRSEQAVDNETKAEDSVALAFVGGRIRLLSLSRDGSYEFLDSLDNLHNIVYVFSGETFRLQQAVGELEEMINDARTKEQDLHEFFERNPEFILNEDYKSARSKIALTNELGETLIPDFLLEPVDQKSLCDLLELKTPSQKVFTLKKSRIRFSAAVMEACAQLREYRTFFDEDHHRRAIESKYGLTVYRPKMFVIIGRKGSLSPVERRRVEGDLPDFTIKTYDDLVERIKNRIRRMTVGGTNTPR